MEGLSEESQSGLHTGGWNCRFVARYTLEFLDAYLKHDAQVRAFLKKTPAEVGVSPHMMTVDFRAGKGIPAR